MYMLICFFSFVLLLLVIRISNFFDEIQLFWITILLSPYDFSVSVISKQMTSWLSLLAFFLQFEYFLASLVAHVSHIQEQYGIEVTDNYETTCWGCGLRVMLPSCASIFKCGWCGAITDQNKKKRDEKCFWWRILRDRCFVSVVIVFTFFVICKSLLFLRFLLLFVNILFLLDLLLLSSGSRYHFQCFPPLSIFSLIQKVYFI